MAICLLTATPPVPCFHHDLWASKGAKLTDLCLSSKIWTVHILNSTCVTFDRHLLAIGGLNTDHTLSGTSGMPTVDHTPQGTDHTPSDAVYHFDEDSDQWNIVGHLQVSRDRCFAEVLSSKLFVIGGKNGSTLLSSVEIGTFI